MQHNPNPVLGTPNANGDNGPGWTALFMLLPQIEQAGLYNSFNVNLPSWHASNAKPAVTPVPVYRCPSDPSPSPTYNVVDSCGAGASTLATFSLSNYVANAGQIEVWSDPGDLTNRANGPLYRNSRTRMRDISDGLSNTLFFGEQTTHHTIEPRGWASCPTRKPAPRRGSPTPGLMKRRRRSTCTPVRAVRSKSPP